MNVIQRRSSSTFSLSLPHFLALSLSFLLTRSLSLSFSLVLAFLFILSFTRTLSRSFSLSLSRAFSHFLSFFFSIFHAYTLFCTHSVSMSLFACSRAFTTRICACAPLRHAPAHARTSASTHGARIWMDDPSRVMFFFSTASSLKLDFFFFFGFLAHFVYLACWPMAVAWSLYWPTGSAAWHFTWLFSVYIFFLNLLLFSPTLGFFFFFFVLFFLLRIFTSFVFLLNI